MTAIDPHLMRLYHSTPAGKRSNTRVPVLLEWSGDPDTLRQFGFRIGTVIGNIVTAEMPLALLPRLEQIGVRSIEFGHRSSPGLNKSRVDIKADKLPPITGPEVGKGVIIGIIDTGIDYAHPSFQSAAANGRILYIWDRRFEVEKDRKIVNRRYPEEALPRGFSQQFQSGVEYIGKDIKKAVDAQIAAIKKGKKPRMLRCQDTGLAHGTHVAGIACGSGAPPDHVGDPLTYIGVAPQADLIVVALKDWTSTEILEAADYIRLRAGKLKRPCVINLSLGRSLGARDGSSLYERTIDSLTMHSPPAAVVISAGNAADDDMHASRQLKKGDTVSFALKVDNGDPAQSFTTEIWYGLRHPGDDSIGVEVVSPRGTSTGVVRPADRIKFLAVENSNIIAVTTDLNFPESQFNRIEVVIRRARKTSPAISPGAWQIKLTGLRIGNAADAGIFHAYLQRPSRDWKSGDPKLAVFTGALVNEASTLTIPGTAKEAIRVGSYITRPWPGHTDDGKLSEFSSRGPTLDKDARPPTIAAPGEVIISARASTAKRKTDGDYFLRMQGTSMAAPHVTGTVAAMLQVNPSLSQKDIVKILQRTARKVSEDQKANEWGSGKLDAEAAVSAAKPPDA